MPMFLRELSNCHGYFECYHGDIVVVMVMLNV